MGGLLLAMLLTGGATWLPGIGHARPGLRRPPVRRLDEAVVARMAHWAG
jgi:hypothetical protein